MNKKDENKIIRFLTDNREEVFEFLKASFPMFHNSNFFFRDFHYGILRFLNHKNINLTYGQAEKIAKEFAQILEQEGIFIRINQTGWKVNYPEFATQVPGDPL
ncbi:MAG: hypothetical protein Kow0098_09290 [Ignavibacteriaceae bacterium]